MEPRLIYRHTHALEAALASYGLRFELTGSIGFVPADPIFVAGGAPAKAALEAAEKKRGSALPLAERRTLIASFVAAPLRALLAKIRPADTHELQLVFVDRIVSIDSPVAAGLIDPAGLTLSPFADANDNPEIEALLGMPLADMPAPVVLVSLHEIGRIEPELALTTVAHEVGHAFGLKHAGGRDNLMSPMRLRDCMPGFRDSQLEILDKELPALPPRR